MRFESLIIQYGPVPPAGGPARDEYLRKHGHIALQLARAELAEARSVIGTKWGYIPRRSADIAWREWDEVADRKAWRRLRSLLSPNQKTLLQNYLRDAEKHAVNAFNYLETTEFAEPAHALIHETGRLRGGILGCEITADDDHLWIDCRTRIAHLRTGMSVGMTADLICSICSRAIEDCDHMPGQIYEKLASKTASNACSICDALDCIHESGAVYVVEAIARADKITPHEVSHVRYPRYPLCRISKIGLPASPQGAVYKHALKGGMYCDACVEPCGGMQEMPESSSDFADFLAYYQPAQRAKLGLPKGQLVD